MTRISALGCLVSVAWIGGCGGSPSGPAGTDPDGGGDVNPDVRPAVSALEACFAAGGTLQELDTINNSQVVDHGAISTIALSSVSRIAVATADGAVKLWTIDGREGEELTGGSRVTYGVPFGMGGPVVRAMEYLPDGTHVVAGDESGRLAVWNVDERMATAVGENEGSPIDAVAIDPDGSIIMVSDKDPTGVIARLRSWTPGTGAFGEPLRTRLWNIWALRLLPGGRRVLAGGHIYSAPIVELHDLDRPGDSVAVWEPRLDHNDVGVSDIATTADGSEAVAVGYGFVAVVDVATLGVAEHTVTQEPDHFARSVALTPTDRFFVTVGTEGSVRLWDLTTLTERSRLELADPVSIRTDARTDQLVVADAHGLVHLVGCDPAP